MPFDHEALFYAGPDAFLDGTLPFVREGVEAGEPVLVAVGPERTADLRRHLGSAAEHVTFAPMRELGRNPACILPVWRQFVTEHGAQAGAPVRGIGEPAWPGRSSDELCECHRHEALLNAAFADAPAFRLLCPYGEQLADAVLEGARRTHPTVVEAGAPRPSAAYVPPAADGGPFQGELSPPPVVPDTLPVAVEHLGALRRFVSQRAAAAGVAGDRLADLLVAVTELATNAIRHGDGGHAAVWLDGDAIVCEVTGGRPLADPLAGRVRPADRALGGWGLWLVNHLCDLVQIRSGPNGTCVRVRMAAA